jgi:hypothetical protein
MDHKRAIDPCSDVTSYFFSLCFFTQCVSAKITSCGRNSHVSCVSDTALSTASMRARILKEITEYGYYVFVYVFKNREKTSNKILRPRGLYRKMTEKTPDENP